MPQALDDGKTGALLPTALDEDSGVAEADAKREKLATPGVSEEAAEDSAVTKGVADVISVPTSVAAGDSVWILGEPHALGDCDCSSLLTAALNEGSESDDTEAAAVSLTPALADA